ncbi:MAG: iron-containing alcohol dehydrogenase [Paracoccaceae bacterium]|nr:iron-containing alcohol dehydrogenase [Paracoccaceae bacterium]
MSNWQGQYDNLILPALARSAATQALLIAPGALAQTGTVATQVFASRKALVCADTAGFAAAGAAACAALRAAGFTVDTLVIPADPLPKASVEAAQVFLDRLSADSALMPVSVGSGVINDLVKYAAFESDRRYLSVATAASMDGYTSAGAPLAKNGFKVTIPVRAPIALIADLDVIAAAPPEMTGWGYADLAGKSPAGGDWLLAELVGVEARDDLAWPLVQDHLRGWLAAPESVSDGGDGCAPLFIGLTAVGFAMEFHGSSRPASGADHQIAHMWEMEGHEHDGRKVSHGAAVAVGCVTALMFYDWLLNQNLEDLAPAAPDLSAALADLHTSIPDRGIAQRAEQETLAKWPNAQMHKDRITRIHRIWPETRATLKHHLFRADEMIAMLRSAQSPALPQDIGISLGHLRRTIRASAFIRSRYTIVDFLKDLGLFEDAVDAVVARQSDLSEKAMSL